MNLLKQATASTLVILLVQSTNLLAQSGPPTPWVLEGNDNVNHHIHWLGTTNTQDLVIKTNSVQRMVVNGLNGNIGIGTGVPAYTLHVTNADNIRTASFENATNGSGNRSAVYAESKGAGAGAKYGGYFEAKNGTGLNHGVYSRASGNGNAYGVRSVANGLATNYGLYSLAQGNGTNYAVYGKALGLFAGLGTNYAIYGEVDATNSAGWAGYFKGRGYFSERVGIGTNNPGAYLHVNADDVTLPFAVQINGASKLKTNTNGSVSIGGVPSGPANGLYVNGDVVIGTSTPATGYKLSINGKVMCTELRVELNNSWPDYVFADNYKLPTIKEMEQHINQYKHLPGIPSAAQMESNGGFDVGLMQTKMMEKIEELSLYIIQLEKKIEKLETTR